MEVLIALAVVGGLVGLIYAANQEQKRWAATLAYVAGEMGLSVDAGTWLKSPQAFGSVDGHAVTIDTYTVSTGKSSQVYTRIRVQTGLGGLLELSAEGMLSALGKAFLGEDVSIGVPAVDDLLVIRAPTPSVALARLGQRGRAAAVAAINGEGAKLKDGQLEWTVSGRVKDPSKLLGAARALTELASALDVGDRHEALADHVCNDPDAGFRYKCLESLAAEAPRSAAAQRAAQAALEDVSPHLQLAAMRFFRMGDAGAVAALVADDGAPSDVRASAIELLTQRFADATAIVVPALQQAFERGRFEAFAAAVRALDALDQVPAVESLRSKLGHATTASTAAVAAALARHEAADAQPLLLELLAHDEVEVVTAAAESLGRVGTVEAVEGLDEAGSGFTTSRDVKLATRAAITRIQERAGGVGGGLSLAAVAGDGGELSLQTLEEGALSEVEG